jgi:hypothetical protein
MHVISIFLKFQNLSNITSQSEVKSTHILSQDISKIVYFKIDSQ